MWLADEVDFDHRIVEVRRIRWAIDGFGLVDARLIVSGVRWHEVDQQISGLTKISEPVANVCAKRNSCSGSHAVILFETKDILHVIKARLAVLQPKCGTNRTRGKGHPG